MADSQTPGEGTLLISALLILALLFAGYWIFTYVQQGADPWALLPWFGIAAAVIIAIAFVAYLRPRRGADPPR